MFQKCPQLSRFLYLRSGLKSRSLPALLAWVHAHHHHITCLQSFCHTPFLEVALTSLCSNTMVLTSIVLQKPTESAVQIMSTCATLQECILQSPVDEPLDLTCMGALPRLHTLVLLAGVYAHVSVGRQLSCMHLLHATVISADRAADIPRLERLRIVDSNFSGLRSTGIGVCKQMTYLACLKSSVFSDNYAHELGCCHDHANLTDRADRVHPTC